MCFIYLYNDYESNASTVNAVLNSAYCISNFIKSFPYLIQLPFIYVSHSPLSISVSITDPCFSQFFAKANIF